MRSDWSDPRSWLRRIAIVLGLILLAAASWLHQRHYDFEHDDAYIAYRYAANWAAGYGPVFNPGERVEGYSNFLHVVMLRECRALGLDIVASSRFAGTLASFALIALTFIFAAVRLQRPPLFALAAAAAVAMHAALAAWARSGLETVPFAFCVTAAACVFTGEIRRRSLHVASGMLFGIASLMRPDGFLFAVLTLLYLIGWRRSRRRIAGFLAAYTVVCVPYLLWRIGYYGYPLPNSYYLKTGGDVFQQVRGLFYAYLFIGPFGGFALFGLPLVLLALRDDRRNDVRFYLGALVLGFGAYIVWVGGDHMPMSRFFVPLIAPMTLLFMEAAIELGGLFLGHRIAARVVGPVVMLVVIASAVAPTLNQRRLPASYVISHRTLVRQWTMGGLWLHDHYPATTWMATEPAGAVAYFSGLRIIDMLGVNDLHIAHLDVATMGHGAAGHEKRDLPYVLSRRPQLIFRGVRPERENPGTITTYEDGARFRLRCEPLGLGPVADAFGTVTQESLYVWVDESLR